MPSLPEQSPHRVVVLGSGFGGLFATKALRRAPVDVTLIDRSTAHLFHRCCTRSRRASCPSATSPGITGESGEQPPAVALLSPQELEIARLAAEGLSNRETGQRLSLSPRTVGSHLYRIFSKLGVSVRTQLARRLGSRPQAVRQPATTSRQSAS